MEPANRISGTLTIHKGRLVNKTYLSIYNLILLDFSLTVKAATLIFISGRGSAISSTKEGKSGFIYNLVKSKSAFWDAQTFVHFMKIPHTELTFLNPYSA